MLYANLLHNEPSLRKMMKVSVEFHVKYGLCLTNTNQK